MACELLVRLDHKIYNDNSADGFKSHKGDIFDVKPYPNNGWGSLEQEPYFTRIIVTDMDAEEIQHDTEVGRKRNKYLKWSLVKDAERSRLENGITMSIDKSEFKKIENKE